MEKYWQIVTEEEMNNPNIIKIPVTGDRKLEEVINVDPNRVSVMI